GRSDPLHLGDVGSARGAKAGDGSEVPEQLLHARRSEAGDLGEHGPDIALASLALVRDREPVGLVAHSLEEEERVAVAREDDREVAVGRPDLLESLRDAAEVDAVDTRLP